MQKKLRLDRNVGNLAIFRFVWLEARKVYRLLGGPLSGAKKSGQFVGLRKVIGASATGSALTSQAP
jgi:hypothetical protein